MQPTAICRKPALHSIKIATNTAKNEFYNKVNATFVGNNLSAWQQQHS
jgi:hypothetical protein